MGDRTNGDAGEVSRLVQRVRDGDAGAADALFPLLYAELRGLARMRMRAEGAGHTLQPTALTHEAYLRLARDPDGAWADRAHFLASAAVAMRRILIEHARARRRVKRGGGRAPVAFSAIPEIADVRGGADPVDVLALDRALQSLAIADDRKARVVELLYFGGLSAEEAAVVLGLSARTVERDWQYARLWLLRAMTGDGERR